MKKILSFIVAFLFCVGAGAADYRAALVADMDTGRVIFSEHANDANYPASLTKIMTLYLTFDALEHGRLHLDDYLIVSQSARVLAENLKGGKEGNFASLMTRVAREIGLARTNFENSSGLPDDDHLSTARDIALLSMAVYKHFPQYWKYFGIKTWTYNGKTYTNGNRLLETYPGCDGMKTGYTDKSKYSLVATAARGGHHLLSVVLGAENKDVRATVSTRLLNRGFETYGIGAAANYAVEPAPVTSPIVQKYADDAPRIAPVTTPTYATGGVGVQFGAFGSVDSANAMIARVKNATGATAHLEPNGAGLYRVRVTGLSESAAQNLKNRASSAGIDCYVFH